MEISKTQLNLFRKEEQGLEKEYLELCGLIHSIDKNYPKMMYDNLNKALELGKRVYSEFTIMKLCDNCNITYERYKFYMKYRFVNERMETLIKENKIKPATLLNIIHRYPRNQWWSVISKQVKYKLSKNDVVVLRHRSMYKRTEVWKKKSDERALKRTKDKHFCNKRQLFIDCDKVISGLKLLEMQTDKAKRESFNKVLELKYALDYWLKKHGEWSK